MNSSTAVYTEHDLPPFNQIKPEEIMPALKALLAEQCNWLEQRLAEKTNPTWDNLVYPLNEANNTLEKMWAPVGHLNAVMNTDELREVYNHCLPLLSEHHTKIGQNQALYTAFKVIREQAAQSGLDQAQVKALDDALLSFQLSGVSLVAKDKQRFSEIAQKLSQLSARFSDNVLDATHNWYHTITSEEELKGLPDYALAMAQQAAQQRNVDGWVITLDFPAYLAVMQYADNRDLREKVYRAYTTRASALGEKTEHDNSQVIRDILRLRQEQAELLGYTNYAEVSLAAKMADDTEAVVKFLRDLATQTKPFAEQEYTELLAFAEQQLAIPAPFEAWDVTYTSEKIKQARFGFSEEALKPYFPVDQVISGLFKLVNHLYKVRITPSEDNVDLWHPDVRFYQIHDQHGQLCAEFYLDLYARKHKRGGAWMSDFCGRFRRRDGVQTPVAFMTCNGTPPVGEQPALFTHDEVVTLFHEFGHGLHHMLTQVDYPDISGINGVEWDAVELPSQFMENWCWEPEVLEMIAGHWQSGEKLPEELFNKMQSARHFQSAMVMVRQLEFALFDMLLHMNPDAAREGQLEQILQAVRDEVAVVQPPPFNRSIHSFSHIFAGGYAAGYYSYKWAEVLSADAYARFEEDGLFNQATGKDFLTEILQAGGSRPAMVSFKAFRGREPSIEPLLRHSGLTAQAT